MRQQLTPILLPTEDASPISLLDNGLYHNTNVHEVNNGLKRHHLYLCSTQEIKKGEWYIERGVLKQAECFISRNHTFGKIEFTTDPMLISGVGAQGIVQFGKKVPAIDGNTKAEVKYVIHNGGMREIFEVNFLSEFVKRWNEKDNQKGVDVERLAWYILNENHCNKDERSVRAMKEMYNQALQSNAGGFSLEDIREAMDEISKFALRTPDLCYRDDYENKKESIIQSLTKEQPKGDIVVECEMELDNDDANNYNPETTKYSSKIKLKDGNPILIFK